jgi:transcriptional regulator with XRE-family HTH domain
MSTTTTNGTTVNVDHELGKRIRSARYRSGLTLDQVAFKAGVSRETIRGAELGLRSITVLTLCLIASALGTTGAMLLRGI